MSGLAATPTAAKVEGVTPRKSSWAQEDAGKFVAELADLRKKDRGRMAELRRNAGETLPGRGTSWFYAYLYSPHRQRYGEIYFLVATLFDLNRRGLRHPGDFGLILRQAVSSASEEGMKRRFRILLDATFDRIYDPFNEAVSWQDGGGELAYRLRQMVKLLASKNLGVDWAELLVDLCRWSHPEKRVQKKWARSYFGGPAAQGPAETENTEAPTQTLND
jgi:CRISPR system Cascade subunit CasB